VPPKKGARKKARENVLLNFKCEPLSMFGFRWPLPERRPATPAARLGRSGGSGQNGVLGEPCLSGWPLPSCWLRSLHYCHRQRDSRSCDIAQAAAQSGTSLRVGRGPDGSPFTRQSQGAQALKCGGAAAKLLEKLCDVGEKRIAEMDAARL